MACGRCQQLQKLSCGNPLKFDTQRSKVPLRARASAITGLCLPYRPGRTSARPTSTCQHRVAAEPEAQSAAPDPILAPEAAAEVQRGAEEAPAEPRDDDVLPDSLGEALAHASEATLAALERGVSRCVVEVLLPEFWDPISGAIFSEEGDQGRFWKLTRKFIDNLMPPGSAKRVKAVYPDSGVAAMLRNSWKDAQFGFSSLNDRRPVQDDDEIIVVAAPDPQGLDEAKKIVAALQDERPVILFNPRLASGDVGVGLNVRRMRSKFLAGFTTTYSLRPIGEAASVFRRYPGLWQTFVEDAEAPGRFRLAAETPDRPVGDKLDAILMEAFGGGASADGQDTDSQSQAPVLSQLRSTLGSVQRFMKQLSQ